MTGLYGPPRPNGWSRFWRHPGAQVFVVVVVLVGIYWALSQKVLDSQILLVWGSVVAALATAVAAFAAFNAAAESRNAARDARLAIALALKPDPQLLLQPGMNMYSDSPGQAFTLTIENYSMNATGSVHVSWELRDGGAGERRVDQIAGRTRPFGGMIHEKGPHVEIDLGAHDASLLGVDRVVVVFSDPQGLHRWERRREWRYVPREDGSSHTRRQEDFPDRLLH